MTMSDSFDPAREPRWPLNERHMRLPKWAQDEIHGLLCDQITADFDACINGEVRRMAKRVLGGNCTFADDDLHLMALLAEAAIDAGLHEQISDRWTKANIEQAKARRARERDAIATEAGTAETPQSGSVHEGAGPKVIAHD